MEAHYDARIGNCTGVITKLMKGALGEMRSKEESCFDEKWELDPIKKGRRDEYSEAVPS
jgi:hypothetical protein